MGNYEAALAFFDKALSLKPDYNDAALAKGFVLTKLGRKDEAKQCTDKLLETKKEAAAEATQKTQITLRLMIHAGRIMRRLRESSKTPFPHPK